MSALTLVHPHASVVPSSTWGWRSSILLVAKLWRDLLRELLSPYRPELHYMRGPGPKWRERHGAWQATARSQVFNTGAGATS